MGFYCRRAARIKISHGDTEITKWKAGVHRIVDRLPSSESSLVPAFLRQQGTSQREPNIVLPLRGESTVHDCPGVPLAECMRLFHRRFDDAV